MKKMNKFLLFAAGILVLTGCKRGFDMSEIPQDPETTSTEVEEVTSEDIAANVAKVFGVTFDPEHTWCTTTSGELRINFNTSIKKVQILACVSEQDEEGNTVTSMKVLNEAETDNKITMKLRYDAPSDNLGLYVAFISDNTYQLRKVSGDNVTLTAANTRAASKSPVLPSGELKLDLSKTVESYASQRGWLPGEKLYELADYDALKMAAEGYSDDFTETFRKMVFSYFKNKANNLPLVKKSGYYNEKIYPFTTGDEPIIVSAVYKQDGASTWGNEVFNSDLYYYYFKDSDLGSNPTAYLESLPKYKAFPFNEFFSGDKSDDDKIAKNNSFALIYWGDGVPNENTRGSFTFPKGYKIGFMVRAKTTFAETGNNADPNKNDRIPRKQGELYGDGRLNNHINSYIRCNFISSGLGTDGPRATWLSLNDHLLMCWESGADKDFNDIILEVEGGIEKFVVVPDVEYNSYTYCFEDTPVGDYDLNDIVIKAVRKNSTTVEYSIVACGAWDEICVRNINSGKITDDAEVHALFGMEPKQFINTEIGSEKLDPITATKTVASSFSFLDPDTQPYIYDKTRGNTVYLSKIGQDPHGIMIPNDFKYPLEKVCIKNAYKEFNGWGQNAVTYTDWYTKPVEGKVYDK